MRIRRPNNGKRHIVWKWCLRGLSTLIALALLSDGAPRAVAAIAGLERVGTGLSFPAFATTAPGDNNRLFVGELGGQIRIIDLVTKTVTGTFLTVADTNNEGEGGLLGIAFHPDYFSTDPNNPGRGKFYVNVTVDNGEPDNDPPFSTHIREYSALGDPATSNIADPASGREILRFTQPQSNHNGGWIGFNPQLTPNQPQYLYIMSGDGGGGGDSGTGHTPGTGNAQDVTDNFLGKVLRIDVNGDDFPGNTAPNNTKNYALPPGNPFNGGDGDREIWAYGLRNPFRASFDRLTGDLWIGDVGEGAREEVDFQPASKTTVSNYGWRLWEGNTNHAAAPTDPFPPNYVGPIWDYTRGDGDLQGETVIGGFRYRGPDPDLQGRYYFNDASDVNVWEMVPPEPVSPTTSVVNINALLGDLSGIQRFVSFAEDPKGNLYLVDLLGSVYRIVTNNLLVGDFDADGNVDANDYAAWRDAFNGPNPNPASDANGNEIFDAADYVAWRRNLGSSVHTTGTGATVPEAGAGLYLVGLCELLACVARLPRSRRGAT